MGKQLVSKTESSENVTYIYREDGMSSDSKLIIPKSPPLQWTYIPGDPEAVGLDDAWDELVLRLDGDFGEE